MNDMAYQSLTVRRLDDTWAERWDAFVDVCAGATFFHRSAWQRVITDSFGHACYYLLAESGGYVRGVLPLVHINSWLFGNALISNAFCVYGGVLAGDDAARAALDEAALTLAASLGVDYVEYRSRTRTKPDWSVNDALYVTFRKEIDPDPDRNLAAIPRKQRAMVRKGIANNLQGEIDDGVERFFPIYAESVRNLGTPVFAKRYFKALKQHFGDACEILVVTADRQPLAAVMSFYFRDEVLPYYGGSVAAARSLAANDFMYWDVMRRACAGHCRVFDFGRSKLGTGSFAFKKHWGFEPVALPYEYKLVTAKEVPSINPTNPKYALYIKAWKRLPLVVANAIGPMLARQLG